MTHAVALMNSHSIADELRHLAETQHIDDAKIGVVFGLVFSHPEYENRKINQLASELSSKTSEKLLALAKDIHPVLCSLTVDDDPGGESWQAKCASARGQRGKVLSFNRHVVTSQ